MPEGGPARNHEVVNTHLWVSDAEQLTDHQLSLDSLLLSATMPYNLSVVLYLVSSIKHHCIDRVKTMMANSIHQEALHVILQKLHTTLTSWETMAGAETEQDNKSLLMKLAVKLIFLIFRNSEAVVFAFEILVKGLKGDFFFFFFPL